MKMLESEAGKCKKITTLFSIVKKNQEGSSVIISPSTSTSESTSRYVSKEDRVPLSNGNKLTSQSMMEVELSSTKETNKVNFKLMSELDQEPEKLLVTPFLVNEKAVDSKKQSLKQSDTYGKYLEQQLTQENRDDSLENVPSTIFTTDEEQPTQIGKTNTSEFFKRPKPEDMDEFFKFHPQQISTDPIIQKTFRRKDGTSRGWISYYEEKKTLFCMVCLAYCKKTEINSLTDGLSDRRHIHQRVEEHEKSECHSRCSEAYILGTNSSNIRSLLFNDQMNLRYTQVSKRREIMERVVNVIKVIGKRGLSYRGKRDESAFALENEGFDHGNFLEMLLLLAKYDKCLRDHIAGCINQSEENTKSKRKTRQNEDSKKNKKKGRGNFVTMLSKNTVNHVIDVIGKQIQQQISHEVNEAEIFSLQIDTTQDISCQDQCSIVIRYVLNCKINEKLLSVVRCDLTTGEAFKQIVTKVMTDNGINLKNCIGSSTEGASNMQGQYNGFSAKLIADTPEHVHIWCYAHVLNLVLSDTTSSVISSASLFSLLNDITVLFRSSYLRMDTWERVAEDSKHRKLNTIGETRWWSKSNALAKIFGSVENKDKSLFVKVILALNAIENNKETKPDARVKAKSYKDALLKFETILIAHIYIAIFSKTTPLSKYLQTSNLDILKAYQLVQGTMQQLTNMRSEFGLIKEKADFFVDWAQTKLDDTHFDVCVESCLPNKRAKKRKLMPGEVTQDQDEAINDPNKAFEVDVFLVIIDTCNSSLSRRFSPLSKTLFSDLALLDPRSFDEVKNFNEAELPPAMFVEISKKLIKFNREASPENIRHEFFNLAQNWEKIKTSSLEDYTLDFQKATGNFYEEFEAEETEGLLEDDDFNIRTCKSCKNCAICCYKLLNRYNLMTGAYTLMSLAYKYLLTLSFSQVGCERSFSILKYIKTRLRSSLTQDKLESFMLMSCEKDTLASLDMDKIIDDVACKSQLLTSLLKY